eukprot:TRINITY_DN997_c1_g1_i1.p1 TRINITY_DN997_c1_g1~~TRINITY_DN997_c1_g1_i1.p1  ORF type:complete len:280 (+),score=110.59 TRINITY_DN997_c1_g1_i1:95-934(+)
MDIDQIPTETYSQAREHLPPEGKFITACYTDDAVLVYQAYNDQIGNYVAKNGTFEGCPGFYSRMSWIKTNYLWMMYRSGWAAKKNQTKILGIWLRRSYFEKVLINAVPAFSYHDSIWEKKNRKVEMAKQKKNKKVVRLQWDPYHSPSGGKLTLRAIQLGLNPPFLKDPCYETSDIDDSNEDPIIKIIDMTPFVLENKFKTGMEQNDIIIPQERIYPVDEEIAYNIALYRQKEEEELEEELEEEEDISNNNNNNENEEKNNEENNDDNNNEEKKESNNEN